MSARARRRQFVPAAIAAVAVTGVLASGVAYLPAASGAARPPGPFVDGSAGLGDPYFPLAGNGGYDVRHYSLRLDYVRTGNHLRASALISARATQNLRRFDLDLRGFTITRLGVNHQPATFARDGQELVVTPRHPLRAHTPFVVRVDYAGHPTRVVDPDGSAEGWVPTNDGAFVVNEPQGAPGWFPANDNPRDKARYDFAITVPAGITAIANGRLVSRRNHGGKTTWRWHQGQPMASYLATATNGVFRLRVAHLGRLPLYHAVDPVEVPNGAFAQLSAEAGIIRFFSHLYGRYPFSSGGGVVDHAPDVGYALESQTKVQYDSTPDRGTVVHETAHQWFGDSVTLAIWPDIWLNEGFATWSEWIYSERHGGRTAQQSFNQLYATPASSSFWKRPPADLGGPAFLFTAPAYDRGAMTLQALRRKVGDATFFSILRAWATRHRYGNATTPQFIALSEAKSGRSLDHFFHIWLYRSGKP